MLIVAKTLSDQAFDRIRERILSSELAPLTQIRQDAFAEELGISRIPLREALMRLEQEGLLIAHANRGFVVAPISFSEAEEVFALRLKIEPAAAAEASLTADANHRDSAVAALASLEASMLSNSSRTGDLNRNFHLTLIDSNQQRLTYQIVERLNVVAERYVRKHLELEPRNARAIQEHREILEAWLDRDSKSVERLISAHILETLIDLRTELSTPPGTSRGIQQS